MSAAPTVLFPYLSTRVGGSYVSSSLLVHYLERLPDWQVRVCLPERGLNAPLFETASFRPDYLGLRDAGSDVTASGLLRRLRYYGLRNRVQSYARSLRYLRRHRPDLIHVNDAGSLMVWGAAAKLLKIPVVWHVRDESRHKNDLYHLALSDHLIFVADANRVRFEGFKRLPPHSTIHNAVDLQTFHPPQSRAAAKAALGLEPNRLTLGFVGNLVERKRPEWVVQAGLDLLRQGCNVQVIIAGKDYSKDGTYRRKLEGLIEGQGLSRHIHLLGYRDDIPELMRAMDILALTSVEHGEAFPRAVIEAMASGAAVVATRVAGVPEAISDGVSGILTSPHSYDSFLQGVKQVVEDQELRERLACQGYHQARSRFSSEACGQQTVATYEKVLGS